MLELLLAIQKFYKNSDQEERDVLEKFLNPLNDITPKKLTHLNLAKTYHVIILKHYMPDSQPFLNPFIDLITRMILLFLCFKTDFTFSKFLLLSFLNKSF